MSDFQCTSCGGLYPSRYNYCPYCGKKTYPSAPFQSRTLVVADIESDMYQDYFGNGSVDADSYTVRLKGFGFELEYQEKQKDQLPHIGDEIEVTFSRPKTDN